MWFGGDDHFATNFVGQIMGLAEFHHRSASVPAEFGFEATGFIVNARMNHPTIVSGLVIGPIGFFFEE